jgi:hypothetical protein
MFSPLGPSIHYMTVLMEHFRPHCGINRAGYRFPAEMPKADPALASDESLASSGSWLDERFGEDNALSQTAVTNHLQRLLVR